MMHPVTCAGLSFVATASLLIWDVFDEPEYPAAPASSAGTLDPSARYPLALPLAAPNDLLCEDPRIAARRMMPQAQVWRHDPGATCP